MAQNRTVDIAAQLVDRIGGYQPAGGGSNVIKKPSLADILERICKCLEKVECRIDTEDLERWTARLEKLTKKG